MPSNGGSEYAKQEQFFRQQKSDEDTVLSWSFLGDSKGRPYMACPVVYSRAIVKAVYCRKPPPQTLPPITREGHLRESFEYLGSHSLLVS